MIYPKIAQNSKLITIPIRKYSVKSFSDLNFEYLTGQDAGIAVIGLNRPKEKNALSTNLVTELNTTLDKINEENKTRVLIVRSLIPGVFCAGADLKERATMTHPQIDRFLTNLNRLTDKIHHFQLPIIAALDGAALGGGLELALACDLRIAAQPAKLGLVETRLAIIPGAGGTQRLPRLINHALAKELIYTARVLSGLEAEGMGLVNEAVEQNDDGNGAFLKALALAREILPNGPVAVRMAKKAINRGLDEDLEGGLSVERACYAQVMPTRDRTEGLEAFKAKRKPIYIGE